MTTRDGQTWIFDPLDTLFFRESRPMDSIGNSELNSLFPPTARTMVGAIRSAIGELNSIDWLDYRKNKDKHPLAKTIGYGGDNLGCLSFDGVWIQSGSERLYPVPLNIMHQKSNDKHEELFFIPISEQLTQTDIGSIRLPQLSKEQAGSKTLENVWLTASDIQLVLRGKAPEIGNLYYLRPKSLQDKQTRCLLVEEGRVGIARDNVRRNVHKGLLYQTRHVRLVDDVCLAMDVYGLEKTSLINNHHLARLGGEGRLASIKTQSIPQFPEAPEPSDFKIEKDETVYFILYLLSPLLSGFQQGGWRPLPEFEQSKIGEQTVWTGSLNGLSVTLHTAITAKAHREGGWDLLNHKPKPVKSYIPPGSVFYCSSFEKLEDIVGNLHGKQIGGEQKLGRGKTAVGAWK